MGFMFQCFTVAGFHCSWTKAAFQLAPHLFLVSPHNFSSSLILTVFPQNTPLNHLCENYKDSAFEEVVRGKTAIEYRIRTAYISLSTIKI
jgi:hypothetical protein